MIGKIKGISLCNDDRKGELQSVRLCYFLNICGAIPPREEGLRSAMLQGWF
jgi:hypothetical protein